MMIENERQDETSSSGLLVDDMFIWKGKKIHGINSTDCSEFGWIKNFMRKNGRLCGYWKTVDYELNAFKSINSTKNEASFISKPELDSINSEN